MTNGIRVRAYGGPDVMTYEAIELAPPAEGEVRVNNKAIGVNFIDVYFRTGLYPSPKGLPYVPGNEGAGMVTALGAGVSGLKIGDRVAYVSTLGSYAQETNMPAARLLKLPQAIAFDTAAAMMLKGMTAGCLLRRVYDIRPGQVVLFHAAAGGVGLIAGQWGKHLGATMIGTVGSAEKAALAKAHGYDHVINYNEENFVERVKEITGGKGVDVAYDSVGKTTWLGSLDCLRQRGMFVSFGQSSGMIEGFTMAHLAQRGALFATRPSLQFYTGTRSELELSGNSLFEIVASGAVKININQSFSLNDAANAHRALEARSTTGATILLP